VGGAEESRTTTDFGSAMLSITRWLILLAVLLLALCLGFWCFVVLDKTLLADGILIVASDGAEMRVKGNSLIVHAGLADSPRFSPMFPYVAASVYLLLVILALLGANSLFPTLQNNSNLTH
jgi:hypothetical protein